MLDLYGCCKIRSRCCICCNDCTRMLQRPVTNVSSVFSDVCCKCVYLDVAYVCNVFSSVSEACFKCFICLLLYVASVVSECFKSRSGYCICYNGCTRMLQRSVTNVSSVFSDECCKCVYLNVVYVLHICCKYFVWMWLMFYNGFQVFFNVFL